MDRKAKIAAMPRKELNAHAFLLEQEQEEYEKQIKQLKEDRAKYFMEAKRERELGESIVAEREELIIENERLRAYLSELRENTPYGLYQEQITNVLNDGWQRT